MQIPDVRVAPAFFSKITFWAMAGNEHGFVAHGPKALFDAVDEGVEIAARKVSSANAASKQYIAYKSPLSLC